MSLYENALTCRLSRKTKSPHPFCLSSIPLITVFDSLLEMIGRQVLVSWKRG